MVQRTLLMAAASAALVLGLSQPSHANLTLTLTDGAVSVTVTDAAALGMISFVAGPGDLPDFRASATTALSKPTIGSAALADLDLSSIAATNTSVGTATLTIKATDDNFTGFNGVAEFLNTVGGTQSAGTLKIDTFLGCGAQTTSLTTQTFTTSPFSGSASGLASCAGDYSLTQIATLTLPGGAHVSFDSDLAIPEPASLAIFGASLLGAGVALRRRKKANS